MEAKKKVCVISGKIRFFSVYVFSVSDFAGGLYCKHEWCKTYYWVLVASRISCFLQAAVYLYRKERVFFLVRYSDGDYLSVEHFL